MHVNFRLCAAIFVAALLLFGLMYRSANSRDKVFEGVLDWGPMQTIFYPDGNCFSSHYRYTGSRNSLADLNVRRQELGQPHAMWVKFRGEVSFIGGDPRFGISYTRDLRSTEILEARPATGCTR